LYIYKPTQWFEVLFQFHKADTLRKLWVMIAIIALYSAVVAYLEMHYLDIDKKPWLRNLGTMHTLLGFALSLLLVFRTNTAYDRWWEGRKLWGSLVNNSRNLAIKLQAMLPPHDEHNRSFFRRVIPLYADVLRQHLQAESTRLQLDEKAHPELAGVKPGKHVPNQVARLMADRIIQMRRQELLTAEELIILNGEIVCFTDVCGACERIKNTPIPYSYSAFIKKFIFIYVMTLPFGYVYTLSFWIIPVVAIVFYVLASLELIAEEIEDPFGMDSNDLPMAKIADNIKKHVEEII
jgi:putative membrane protein